jgi:transposase
MGGSRGSSIADADRQWLLELIARQPDLTLQELRAELALRRGLSVGYGTIWRFCAREKLSFKKKSARRSAGQARRR